MGILRRRKFYRYTELVRVLLRETRGTAVIELAITLPLLITMLFGIVAYGDWFFVAHSVQQAANDAARATVAGLSAPERAIIAQDSVKTTLTRTGALDPTKASVMINDDGTTLVVRLDYDASGNPLLSLKLLPMPSTTITRSAAIRLGGL